MFQNGTLIALISLIFVPFVAQAAFRGKGVEYGGDSSSFGTQEIGVWIASTAADQEHINTLIRRTNWNTGDVSTDQMKRAWELGFQYGYRPGNSMIEWLLRPSYFYQKTDGSGATGSYKYSVTGITLFPMARVIPLENQFMKFYAQAGFGYGRTYGKIEEAAASVEMQGDAYGTQLGVGLEFCFEGVHCLGFETNYRYMKMARNIATAASGTFSSGVSQATTNVEVETDGQDLALQMGGLQFVLGYAAHF